MQVRLNRGRTGRVVGALALILGMTAVSACVVDESANGIKPLAVDVPAQPEIAALVPTDIRAGGTLKIGTNVPYQPNEFKDRHGNIIGFDVDLMNAVAKVLDLKPTYFEADFEKIIPAVQAGSFQMGMSSFTDTKERERQVDMVTYFNAGVQWATKDGRELDPDHACGLRVGVQATTVEDTDEVPAKSDECVARGEDPIVKVRFDTQDLVVNAAILGQVDAFSADSPVTAYAVKQTQGQLHEVGPAYDSAPYGWPVAKGSRLGPALQKALQYLIDNGQYRTINEHWGVQAGMIETSVINGAKE